MSMGMYRYLPLAPGVYSREILGSQLFRQGEWREMEKVEISPINSLVARLLPGPSVNQSSYWQANLTIICTSNLKATLKGADCTLRHLDHRLFPIRMPGTKSTWKTKAYESCPIYIIFSIRGRAKVSYYGKGSISSSMMSLRSVEGRYRVKSSR